MNTTIESKVWNCPQCGKPFTSKGLMQGHMLNLPVDHQRASNPSDTAAYCANADCGHGEDDHNNAGFCMENCDCARYLSGDDPDTAAQWSGSPDPCDPDNYWLGDKTGERVSAATGERSKHTCNSDTAAGAAGGHTPTPWRVQDTADHVSVVVDSQQVCQMVRFPNDDERRANAGFIVQAVNSHASLVAALEALVSYVENDCEATYRNGTLIGKGRAALATARGKEVA